MHKDQDPLDIRDPIQDTAQFFGRTREITDILRLIQSGQHVSIIGGPKVGKSSLLHRLVQVGSETPGASFVLIDLPSITTLAEFYGRVMATTAITTTRLCAMRRLTRCGRWRPIVLQNRFNEC
jgi:MoxR-like ATPase